MALTADELALIRVEIGDTAPPTDADLQAIYLRTSSTREVVREVLTKRLANLLARPTSFTIPGDYSESWAGQVDALQAKLTGFGGGALGTTIAQIVRDDSGR